MFILGGSGLVESVPFLFSVTSAQAPMMQALAPLSWWVLHRDAIAGKSPQNRYRAHSFRDPCTIQLQ